MTVSIEKQVDTLFFGAEFGDLELEKSMRREFTERLKKAAAEGRPLRVYAGYDPSRPDLHLGHSITLRKLRQFQEFGHDVTFLVGTFTAQVGDTSDKKSGRPRNTEEEVKLSAQSYADQCFKILDREKTRVLYNADWLGELRLGDVISVASNFTVQQFLVRDNYRQRLDAGQPVGLHEFLYALLQGYDALHLKCDVQLGATEQLFNIMAGRKLQQAAGEPPSICITYPILVGTDGTMRMSKTTGNYVGISEPPREQFGKTMAISDETALEWTKYVTDWPAEKVQKFIDDTREGRVHPMDQKKALAREIVTMYHGPEAATDAQQHFESVHQHRAIPDDVPTYTLAKPVSIIDLMVDAGLAPSKSQSRRLIEGRGVRVDGELVIDGTAIVDSDCQFRVGNRRFLNVVVMTCPPKTRTAAS